MPNIKGGLNLVKKMLASDEAAEALAKFDAGSKMSKAENIAAGLYHPIGEGKKLNVPFSRMTSTVMDNPNVIMHQGRIITPEQAVKDRMGFFPLIGDRAETGKILTHVNNRKAKYETPLTGGGKYGQANYDPVMEKSSAWESGKGKVGTLRNRITDIAKSGYQPVGVFSPGSHVQVDFNTMMPHALLGQFDKTDTTKKLVKQFDKEVKSIYPDWVGITSPEAEAQLMDKGNGVLRTVFTKTMGKDDYQAGGFPDVPSVRKAISDPDLYDTELGTLGQNLAVFDPTGALVATPKNPSAYPLSMSGQNIGKMDETEKFSDFFTTANERRRLLGSDPAGDYRSFELSQPIQYADEEWLNKLRENRRLRDEAIKKGGYAKGGSVDIKAADARLAAAIQQRMAKGGEVDMEAADARLSAAIAQHMAGGGKLKALVDIGKKFLADTPQAEALKLAQQRAVLPPAKGGLGLPADNTPQQRAKAMGFDIDAYHATDADILAFDKSLLGSNTSRNTGGDPEAVKSAMRGHWFSDRDLTNKDPRGFMFGDVSYPVKLSKAKKINDKEFGSTSYIVKDPDNIRSRFAAFDPFRRDAATAAAMGVLAPDLMAEETKKAQGGLTMAGGGLLKSIAKKVVGKSADDVLPTAKQTRIAMMPTARIGLEAPGILIPSKMNNVREAVRNIKGNYGARRVERAADEIPNLEKMYKEDALKEAFTGDNASAMMTMHPADFEKYAIPLEKRVNISPEMQKLAQQGDIDKMTVPTDEYIKHLQRLQEGFDDVPYLNLFKDEVGLPVNPSVIGHEGRHRSRALADMGESSSLVKINPRGDLREGMPRRTQDDFIEALMEELESSGRLVLPEVDGSYRRPPIKLPEIYANGGLTHMASGNVVHMAGAGLVRKGIKSLFGSADEVTPAIKSSTRKFGTETGGLNIIKEPGGNFLNAPSGAHTGGVENALRPLLQAENLDNPKQAQAINKWVNSNLTNYVKKQMATKDDPVRKLAEEGITHVNLDPNDWMEQRAKNARNEAGQPALGKSNAAKAWEDVTDDQIYIEPASNYTARQTLSDKRIVEANPWLDKVAPDTKVAHINTVDDLGFDHIMDVLREDLTAGRIRPDQLSKVSMEQAVRRTYEYDQELAAKMNASKAAAREGLPVYKEYPEGYKWLQLNKPGTFAAESDTMGHSVRGYEPPKGHPDWVEASGDRGSLNYGHGGWEGIKSGKAKIYSLVDSKGAPHATVEVAANDYPGQSAIMEWMRIDNPAAYGQGEGPSYDLAYDKARLILEKSAPQRITQIKGKQNAAPAKEYLPYTQDFVKSGNWSEVRDAGNAGLRRYGDVFNENEQRLIEQTGELVPNHEYLSGEEIQRLHNAITPEGNRLRYNLKGNFTDDGMAKGGNVNQPQHFDGGGIAVPEDVYYEPKPNRISDIKNNAVELYEDAKQQLNRLKNPEAAKQYAKILAAQYLGTVPDLANLAIEYGNPLEMLPGAKLLKTGLTGTGVLDKPSYRSVLEQTDNQTSPRIKYAPPREPLGLAKALQNENGDALFGVEDLIKRQQEAGKMYGKTVYASDDDDSFIIDDNGEKIQLYQTGRFPPLMEFAASVAAGAGLSKLAKGATKAVEGFGKGFDKGYARAMSKQETPFLNELGYDSALDKQPVKLLGQQPQAMTALLGTPEEAITFKKLTYNPIKENKNINAKENINSLRSNNITEQSKKELQSLTELFAEKIKAQGFDVKIEHSGSKAGASSYINVYDPQTGRFLNKPIRISDHSKGPFESQNVINILNPNDDFPKIFDTLNNMRAMGESLVFKQQKYAQNLIDAGVRPKIAYERAKNEVKETPVQPRKRGGLTQSKVR